MCEHDDPDLLKALPPGSDPWRPHESPFIRHLIEEWTNKGMGKFGALQAELVKWLDTKDGPPAYLTIKPGLMYVWSPGELAVAKQYLESIPPELFTLNDWMLVVDYLVQRYLPPDVMIQEAEWLAVKSGVMGHVEAVFKTVTLAQAASFLAAAPVTARSAVNALGLSPYQQAAMDFGRARCAEYVTGVTEVLRGNIRDCIIDWQEAKYLGDPKGVARRSLDGRLLDQFSQANKDWRRISLTEASNNSNNGLIATIKPGEFVKRHERYDGACDFCQGINGKTFEVVSPDAPDKNWDTQIWLGKSNVGRSSSPFKRTPDGLVKRTDEEMWKPAAGTQHPMCRGTWERLSPSAGGTSAEFDAWLRRNMVTKG